MKNSQGYEVVGDDYARPAEFNEHGTGYKERDYSEFPINGLKCARTSQIKRLSEQEILEKIAEKTARNSWASDLADRVGSHVKDQGQSPYCWAHAPTRGCEYAHFMTGAAPLIFSAFDTAWPIKKGVKEGGSGIEAVKSLAEVGTCLESQVPPQTFHVKETPEIIANRLLHRIDVWEDFEADDYQLIYSAICADQPVTVGIPAWGHEVLLTFLTLEGGKDFKSIREGFDNSWGVSWGKNGRGILEGSKRKFDEAGRIAAIKQSIS